jgi:hypothetical protein
MAALLVVWAEIAWSFVRSGLLQPEARKDEGHHVVRHGEQTRTVCWQCILCILGCLFARLWGVAGHHVVRHGQQMMSGRGARMGGLHLQAGKDEVCCVLRMVSRWVLGGAVVVLGGSVLCVQTFARAAYAGVMWCVVHV